MNHVAFHVPAERIEEYRDRLVGRRRRRSADVAQPRRQPVRASSRELHDGVFVRSIYFQDPDGILLEFAAGPGSSPPAT